MHALKSLSNLILHPPHLTDYKYESDSFLTLFLCMLITFYYIKNNYFGNTSCVFKYKICILPELSVFNKTNLVIYFPYLFKY